MGVAVLAAACGSSGGGSASPGVASVGSTTSTPTASTSGSAALDKYGACMRSHGMPSYQNPTDNNGQISFPGVNYSSPQYLKAQAACGDLLPARLNRQPGKISAADQNDYLKAVACIRSHGFPTFPDPTFTGGTVHFATPSGIDENSPQFEKTLATCQKLIPAGLPYSG